MQPNINKITGRYSFEEEICQNSFVTIISKGGMDNTLFRGYIRTIILPLSPNFPNKYIMKDGKVVHCLVTLKKIPDLRDARKILFMFIFFKK